MVINKKDKIIQNARILVVDDDYDTRNIFQRVLKKNAFVVDTAISVKEAKDYILKNNYHIVMTDLMMPDEDGMSLLKYIKEEAPHISVVVISGKATIDTALEAIRSGAEEFIEKPVTDLAYIAIVAKKILKVKWQTNEIQRLNKLLDSELDRKHVIGNSLAIQTILEKVRRTAPLDASVIITGDTGVGKEVFANLIYKNSRRKNQKFVAVNCASLPEGLLESMLFGHKKGSFTGAVRDKEGYFQEADKGTLFLDEITETSLAFQAKLLRTLEKGAVRKVGDDKDFYVDVRVIAASNKNLKIEVEKGKFREDLYYRLNVINIHIPPLNQRPEDIKVLSHFFVKTFCKKYDREILGISDPAMAILKNWEWQGNVRELKNVIEHATALAIYDKIMPEDLPDNLYEVASENSILPLMERYADVPYSEAKREFEKKYILFLLKEYQGDVTKVSNVSQIKRQNLYQKFKQLDIDPNDFRNLENT